MGSSSGGGGGKGGATIKNTKPWNANDLKNSSNFANYLMRSDQGFKPFEAPTYTPFSQETLSGLQGMQNMASQGPTAGVIGGNDFLAQMTQNGGMSAGLLGAMNPMQQVASGQNSIDQGNYQTLWNQSQGPTSASQNLQGMASGAERENPWLMESLQKGAEQIALRSGTGAAGSGRYGSAAAAAGTAGMLGDYYAMPLAQAYENNSNRMLQANGMIDSAEQARLAGMGNAAQGLAGVQGANIANRVNAANMQAGLYNQGLNRSLSSAQLAPGLQSAMYDPYRTMLGVGAAYEDKAQQGIDDAVNKWNANQQRPWNMLSAYNAIVQGQGNLGQQTTQQTQRPSGLLGALGGAASGASAGSMFGPGGTALGGLLGGYYGW
ncbi:MAG: hypothetical protein RJA36_2854 [Pseudomonadota bacterium]